MLIALRSGSRITILWTCCDLVPTPPISKEEVISVTLIRPTMTPSAFDRLRILRFGQHRSREGEIYLRGGSIGSLENDGYIWSILTKLAAIWTRSLKKDKTVLLTIIALWLGVYIFWSRFIAHQMIFSTTHKTIMVLSQQFALCKMVYCRCRYKRSTLWD